MERSLLPCCALCCTARCGSREMPMRGRPHACGAWPWTWVEDSAPVSNSPMGKRSVLWVSNCNAPTASGGLSFLRNASRICMVAGRHAALTVNSCFYHDIFHSEGAPELTACSCCSLDRIW